MHLQTIIFLPWSNDDHTHTHKLVFFLFVFLFLFFIQFRYSSFSFVWQCSCSELLRQSKQSQTTFEWECNNKKMWTIECNNQTEKNGRIAERTNSKFVLVLYICCVVDFCAWSVFTYEIRAPNAPSAMYGSYSGFPSPLRWPTKWSVFLSFDEVLS